MDATAAAWEAQHVGGPKQQPWTWPTPPWPQPDAGLVGCQPLAVQETKVQAPTFQFITSDYNPGGMFEVQEPTGEWRVAHSPY